MKKMLSLLSFIFLTTSSAWATTYPLTIENCGQKETFTKAPERVVALGQNTAEILLLLGLQDKMVASAFWPTKVLPQLAEQNAKVPVLTVEIPTLESILAKNPDFVAAQIQLLMGRTARSPNVKTLSQWASTPICLRACVPQNRTPAISTVAVPRCGICPTFIKRSPILPKSLT